MYALLRPRQLHILQLLRNLCRRTSDIGGSQDGESDISAGAIVGIVLGCIIGLAVLVLVAAFLIRQRGRKRSRRPTADDNRTELQGMPENPNQRTVDQRYELSSPAASQRQMHELDAEGQTNRGSIQGRAQCN